MELFITKILKPYWTETNYVYDKGSMNFIQSEFNLSRAERVVKILTQHERNNGRDTEYGIISATFCKLIFVSDSGEIFR